MSNPVTVIPWHPLDHPHCANCHGLSRPCRTPPPTRPGTWRDDLPTAAELAEQQVVARAHTAARQQERLRTLLADADLRQEDLALVFGVDPKTIHRYLHGDRLPLSKDRLLRSIDGCWRDGDIVTVAYRTYGAARWDDRAERRKAVPQAVRELDAHISREANTLRRRLRLA